MLITQLVPISNSPKVEVVLQNCQNFSQNYFLGQVSTWEEISFFSAFLAVSQETAAMLTDIVNTIILLFNLSSFLSLSLI